MAAGAQEQPQTGQKTGPETGPPSREWTGQSRRRWTRFQVQVPLDVTVLRSGIPDRLPGRTVNLCERGIAAMLAGEVTPGEVVAVEVRLPTTTDPLRARATVRHQDKLHCGLEFVGLTPEQRSAIRAWAKETSAQTDVSTSPKPAAENSKEQGKDKDKKKGDHEEEIEDRKEEKTVPTKAAFGRTRIPVTLGRRRIELRRLLLITLAALLVITGFMFWWRWNREWDELESGLRGQGSAAAEKAQVQVPAEVMERLLIHRVEPTYPPEARRENLQGIIALDIVVGRDGSVLTMHPLNGPDVLARAAMDALRWWKFEPYRINGEAAVAETTVAVEFKR